MQQSSMHQVMGQQPGVTVITQNPPRHEEKLQPSALSQMRVLSILQLIMGIICTIFGIVLICLENTGYVYSISSIGYGIWGGLYFVLVGGIGLGAVSANSSCWLVSAMVLNIICSAMFFLPLISMCAVALTWISVDQYCTYDYSYYYSYSHTCSYHTVQKVGLAFNSLMLLMVIAELVITIWSAALCCGAVCSCCYSRQPGHVIHYNATPMMQTHQVVYPSVPTTSYGISMTGPQITTVQNQYSQYPAAVHQQPVGAFTAQPQGPPSYYANNQGASAENQGYQQPPSTAYPNIPQESK